jgi:hypothetical protein
MRLLRVVLALSLVAGPGFAKPAASVGGETKKTGTVGGKPAVPRAHATTR